MSTILPEIKALGTVWWIEIFTDLDDKRTETVYDGLGSFIDIFEAKYSRFKPDSLITKLNTTGILENPDQMTIEILKYGQDLYRQTDGLFNFLIGEILENRGYDALYSFKIKETKVKIPNPLTDLEINDDKIILKSGRVDLGGFGKGYLVDLLSVELKNIYQLPYFLINGGGDIYASSDNGEPVEIYLEHPIQTGTFIGSTTLLNQGFAASSPHKRQWKIKDKTYNHIVNTTQKNDSDNSDDKNNGIDGTFVKAETVAKADAFATVFLLINPNQIHKIATGNKVKACYLLDNKLLTERGFNHILP
ncbi:MAG: FAD:protein FMN transferase [Candidatus Paceibacterota bacterium]